MGMNPETLGNYRIDAEIGRGGMGVVYRASQMETGEIVAIKVLPAEMARDPGFADRFARGCVDSRGAWYQHTAPDVRAPQGVEQVIGRADIAFEDASGIAPRFGHVRDACAVIHLRRPYRCNGTANAVAIQEVDPFPLRKARQFVRRIGSRPRDDRVSGGEVFDEIATGEAAGAGDENRRVHCRCSYWAW